MDLELIEKRRESGKDRFVWQPFERSERFNHGWWNHPLRVDDASIYLQVQLGGVEVARVELDDRADFTHEFGAPRLGAVALEIQFIEVAPAYRGKGVGTQVIALLSAVNPGRRLVAFSEQADEFWASLGWERYEHPEQAPWRRPLYIQPA